MKGTGHLTGDARVEFEEPFGPSDEETRVGPIPLTVKRGRAITPVEFDLPVVASVDVDLGTPAPLPFPIALSAPTKPSPSRTPPTTSTKTFSKTSTSAPSLNVSTQGGFNMQPRPPAPSRPYIRPTPTFSFDDPERAQLWMPTSAPPPRGRSGPGLFAIGVLMAVAGVGGYMAVKHHAWQQVEPLVARAKELGRSLRTLAPSASPESTPTTAPAAGAGPAANLDNPAPAAPVLRPTVVPIEPERTPPTTAPSSERSKHRSASRHSKRRALQPLSAEAAAEEALLASPPRGR